VAPSGEQELTKLKHYLVLLLFTARCTLVQSAVFRPLSRRRQPPRRIFGHAPRSRRIFLWLSRIPAEFFKRSSQPNIFRRKFGANIQRSLNDTDYIKSSHYF